MSEDEDTASQGDSVEVELVKKIADLGIDDFPANLKWFLTESNKYVQLKKLVDKHLQSKWKTFLDSVASIMGERRFRKLRFFFYILYLLFLYLKILYYFNKNKMTFSIF